MARDRSSRPEAKPLRLFVAVDIPEKLKPQLASALDPVRTRTGIARWTSSVGWHITLKFLGRTWPRLVPEVQDAVETAAAGGAQFQTRFEVIGAFPSARRARVIWVGFLDPDDRFGAIARQLDDLLKEHFVPEKRRFTPHMTVARLDPPRNLVEAVPDALEASLPSDPFVVDRLILYRSQLSPRGATYHSLAQASLPASPRVVDITSRLDR